MKKFIALALLVSSVGLISCSYIWTYNFLPDESYEQPDLKGWILTPDIKHTIRVGRGEDSLLAKKQRFLFNLKFEFSKKREVKNYYDIAIERIIIKYFQLDAEKVLIVSNSYFYGLGEDKILKGIRLIPESPTFETTHGRRTLFIPLEVDSALLTFDAVLSAGKYIVYSKDDLRYPGDSIVVFENAEQVRVPVSMVLYKKSTKEGAIGLVPGH